MGLRPVLVLHGGACRKALRATHFAEVTDSLKQILQSCYPALDTGASAVEVVTRAVSMLEDDPLYNAGFGSKIQSDGKIRMSASIMDGSKRRFGGCVNVEGVKNPIRLARALMRTKDRVLSGEGAKRFAKELELPFASPYTKAQVKKFHARKAGKTGTVGAVALDNKGRLAAATSTGGRGFEYPCRVSDSPTSAGNFANGVGAVSATGIGEQIVEFSTASTICAYLESGQSLNQAVAHVLKQARKAKAEFGFIALDSRGRYLPATTTPSLIWAAATNDKFDFMRDTKTAYR